MGNKRLQEKKVVVTSTTEQRAPEQVRRIGRALIELARAQLEAEAQAEHEQHSNRRKEVGDSGSETTSGAPS